MNKTAKFCIIFLSFLFIKKWVIKQIRKITKANPYTRLIMIGWLETLWGQDCHINIFSIV